MSVQEIHGDARLGPRCHTCGAMMRRILQGTLDGGMENFWQCGSCGAKTKPQFARRLNAMFHIDEDLRLVKSSNCEQVPLDEPLFILRGRDSRAYQTLMFYLDACAGDGTDDRQEQLKALIREFIDFANRHSSRMKLPGVTHGR